MICVKGRITCDDAHSRPSASALPSRDFTSYSTCPGLPKAWIPAAPSLEFVDAALLDVEAGDRIFLAEFDRQRQADIAEADDGDAGIGELGHVSLDEKSAVAERWLLYKARQPGRLAFRGADLPFVGPTSVGRGMLAD